MSGKNTICEAKTAAGKPCKRRAIEGQRYCHAHSTDPERQEKLKEAGKKGGGCPRRPEMTFAEALTPQESRELISGAIGAVMAGEISDSTARAIGYLLQSDLKIKELLEIEKRLEALENSEKRGSNEAPASFRQRRPDSNSSVRNN